MNQKVETENRREAIKKFFKSLGLLGVGVAAGASIFDGSTENYDIDEGSSDSQKSLDYLNDWEQLID